MTSGNGHATILTFTHPPRRVVSLVPSMTESLVDLGAGASLVGVTDFCVVPASLAGVARVGGTKSAAAEKVIELAPDLVIANQEENTRPLVEELERAGLKVWVTFPRSVEDALTLLWTLVRLFRLPQTSSAIVKTIEVTLEWTSRASSSRKPVRVFCPIWRGETGSGQTWWMTFNSHTYAHDVLAKCGGWNVFADRERRYPLGAEAGEAPAQDPAGRDTRYPRVSSAEILAADPEVILLPNEPYAFGETDRGHMEQELAGVSAVRAGRVQLLDGRLITWHGTRLARSLAELPGLLQSA